MGRIEILSTRDLLLRKFGALCREIATFCPAHFLTHGTAVDRGLVLIIIVYRVCWQCGDGGGRLLIVCGRRMRRLKALSESHAVYADASHYRVSSAGLQRGETSYLCQYDSSLRDF